MKKLLCFTLILAMTIPFGCFPASAADTGEMAEVYTTLFSDGESLVTLGRTYSTRLSDGARYSEGFADDTLSRLTDYSFGDDSPVPGTGWVGFDADGAEFTAETVIDLGSVYSGIFSFCARFASASSYGIYLPNEVVFYVSADGAEYNRVGEGAFDSLDDRTVSICSLTAKDRIAARYIKAVIKGSGKIFTDEIFAVRHIIYDRGNGTAADTQGLVYGVDGDSAFVTGYDPSVTLEDTRLSALIPSSADGLTDGTSYIIGRGTDAETTVTADFLSTSRPNHPNLYTANKKYIVIHNTGNYSYGSDAYANHRYMLYNESCDASWHYTVDRDSIYQALPDYSVAYHASDGTYGAGNYYGIGIEICVDEFPQTYSGAEYESWLENCFLPAVERAAVLTAELCVRHGLDPSAAIRQHFDSNGKNCPMQMRYNTQTGTYSRDDGDVWKIFIAAVTRYYSALTGGECAVYESSGRLVIPEYISAGGKTYAVTGIAEDAFTADNIPESIHIGAQIRSIPDILIPFASVDPDNIFVSLTEPLPRPDANLIISDGLLTGIYAGTEVSELLSRFTGTLTLYSADGKEKSTGQVCTGDFLKSPGGRITLAVKGDVDGNGKLTATDYLLIKRYVLGISQPTEEKYEAAKVAGGSRLGASDYLLLKRAILAGDNLAPDDEEDASGGTAEEEGYMKAIWVSQYDLGPILTKNGVQREKTDFERLAVQMFDNIKEDGYNTVFLQVRPFGDSFCPSEFYPPSATVTGAYGRDLEYDPVGILLEIAGERGLSVHAWINPYRLMKPEEILLIDDGYPVKALYSQGRLREVDGRLYLDPSDPDARALIVNGAKELLEAYAFDGLHIDDYFYPTQSEDFDREAFEQSGFDDLAEFRTESVNSLVSALYKAVKGVDQALVFGVSPAGNLSTLKEVYYADAEEWCSEDGYIDYILPQIYFGFLHGSCAFDTMTERWADIIKNDNVKLYIGLTGGKAVDGFNGTEDRYAGTEEGRREWINSTDVLKRSFEYLFGNEDVDGFSFFCYQYLYDRLTGEPNPAIAAEKEGFGALIKNR